MNLLLIFSIIVSFLRLWKDVTTSLKEDDVETATAFKHKVSEEIYVNLELLELSHFPPL